MGMNVLAFRDQIDQNLSDVEFQNLAVALGFDLSNLAGGTKREKILDLIQKMGRDSETHKLIQTLAQMKSGVDWSKSFS